MAWRYGGALERRLVLLLVLAPIVAVAAVGASNGYLIFTQIIDRAAVQVNVIIFMAALSWPFFQPGITGPMYSNAYFREAIRQGWLSPLQCEYAAEVIRYRDAMGGAVKKPLDLNWALTLAIFYDASVCGSALFALAFFPLLDGWTWVVFAVWYVPLVVFVWRFFWHLMRKEGEVAAQMGFRMREIGAQMLEELRQERSFGANFRER
jgi:hypothetical protein